ncbi:hypothetical protein E5K00_04160 [Hymenobacter aquaticus]|uniref:Uncharacterized protein n=1 Tax=Hymenobacter aquaticus TaxID=1867101 RepID=A0A4Z0Q4K2_9BACT|nr:hypothetical protein [Hymenobacter aquaticus]TGE24419.1 hypothetical protein E5K00_04160 [Hymenobacter aquaticus]
MVNNDPPAAEPALLTSLPVAALPISAGWDLTPATDAQPAQLQVALSFDHRPYEGLYQLDAADGQHLVAAFTLPLDPASALDPANYTVTRRVPKGGTFVIEPVAVLAVALSPDQRVVTLTVTEMSHDLRYRQLIPTPITVTLGAIQSNYAASPLTFSGVFELMYGAVKMLVSLPVATRAAQARQQLALLLQPLGQGARLGVATGLLQQPLYWEPARATELVEIWLVPLDKFLADRAAGKAEVATPFLDYSIELPLTNLAVTDAPLVELTWRLTLAPPAPAPGPAPQAPAHASPRLEVLIPPAANTADDLAALAGKLEQLLYQPGQHEIRVALGPEPAGGGQSLWGIRTEANKRPGHQLAEPGQPVVFAAAALAPPLSSAADVPLYDFQPATGIDFTRPAQHVSFAQVDVNEWERLVIDTFDALTTPTYQAAIRRLDELAGTSHEATLRTNKDRWAGVLQHRLRPVFAAQAATNPAAARAAFRQHLGAGPLGAVYRVAALQFATPPAPTSTRPLGQVPHLVGEVSQTEPAGQALTTPPLPLAPAAPLLVFAESPATDQAGEQPHSAPFFDLELAYTGRQLELWPGGEKPADPAAAELRFLTPAGQQWAATPLTSNLGKCRVPVFQHDFRPLVLIAQEMLPAAGSTPDALLRRDCRLTYQQDAHYPPQQLTFTVAANMAAAESQSQLLPAAPPVPAGVFAELAQLRSVYPALAPNLLPVLAGINATTAADQPAVTTGAVALGAFNTMISRLVAASEGAALVQSPADAAGQPPAAPGVTTFGLREGTAPIDAVEALVIHVSPPAPVGLPMPVVALEGYTTQVHTADQEGTWYYFQDAEGRVLAAADSLPLTQRVLTLPGLRILAYQSLQVQVTATYNAELVPGQASAPAFVYTAPPLYFPTDSRQPSDPPTEPLDIATLRPDGEPTHTRRTLAGHLHQLFEYLLPPQMPPALYLRLAGVYTSPLAPGLPPVTTPVLQMPVTLLQLPPAPAHPTAAPDLARIISEVAAGLAAWYQQTRPESAEGAFVFDLDLLSGLGPQPQPLLQLTDLRLGVADITDLP